MMTERIPKAEPRPAPKGYITRRLKCRRPKCGHTFKIVLDASRAWYGADCPVCRAPMAEVTHTIPPKS